MSFDKQGLFNQPFVPGKPVPTPVGNLYFKPVSAIDAIEIGEAFSAKDKTVRERSPALAKTIIATACDETGALQFDASDTDALLRLPAPLWKTLLDAAMEAVGANSKAVEDAEKN